VATNWAKVTNCNSIPLGASKMMLKTFGLQCTNVDTESKVTSRVVGYNSFKSQGFGFWVEVWQNVS
jgi:hypothetical protein